MGNCQAVDAAALVIHHPSGKIERLYWPVTATETMRANPSHYVSLIIPLHVNEEQNQDQKSVIFYRVKLLRPNETLTLGHAYRLITTQDVVKVIRAEKHAKTRKPQAKTVDMMMHKVHLEKPSSASETGWKLDTGMTNDHQAKRAERHKLRVASQNPKPWRPSLQSISEAAS